MDFTQFPPVPSPNSHDAHVKRRHRLSRVGVFRRGENAPYARSDLSYLAYRTAIFRTVNPYFTFGLTSISIGGGHRETSKELTTCSKCPPSFSCQPSIVSTPERDRNSKTAWRI